MPSATINHSAFLVSFSFVLHEITYDRRSASTDRQCKEENNQSEGDEQMARRTRTYKNLLKHFWLRRFTVVHYGRSSTQALARLGS